MSWRDGDTAEFPAVGSDLPGGRRPTHVVGPWALGTRDDPTTEHPAPDDRLGQPHRASPAPGGSPDRRRRLVLGAVGIAAVAAVAVGGVAVGATLDPDGSGTTPAGSVSSTVLNDDEAGSSAVADPTGSGEDPTDDGAGPAQLPGPPAGGPAADGPGPAAGGPGSAAGGGAQGGPRG